MGDRQAGQLEDKRDASFLADSPSEHRPLRWPSASTDDNCLERESGEASGASGEDRALLSPTPPSSSASENPPASASPSPPAPDPTFLPAGPEGRHLTAAEFQGLAALPPELEWFANIDNPRTRRAYRGDLEDFMAFVGIRQAGEFVRVTRAHVIAWRGDLEARGLARATIRRKLSALASLFDHLCECNAVAGNPVDGVKRPRSESREGKTPALGDDQARALLAAPRGDSLKAKRDRAILSMLLYHGLRREELCRLRVGDIEARRGVAHLRVFGKGAKVRYVPLHPATGRLVHEYLEAAGHGEDGGGALFRPVVNNATGEGLARGLDPGSVHREIVARYCREAGIAASGIGPHALRATAATNALDHGADIARVQAWLGHADISTTKMYDRRGERPEESPTFRVEY
ncbi:MAG: tyrosine-type recombinase/integrase [Sumerlaeia bacterium]